MNQLTAAIQDKVRPDHRDRLAVVYIRQSTPQQVEHHQESARLQYALVDYAMVLGWPRERILVIDEDQGRSAASSQGRLGFQHLVAEVGLGRVGVVLGVEMSRLAAPVAIGTSCSRSVRFAIRCLGIPKEFMTPIL